MSSSTVWCVVSQASSATFLQRKARNFFRYTTLQVTTLSLVKQKEFDFHFMKAGGDNIDLQKKAIVF